MVESTQASESVVAKQVNLDVKVKTNPFISTTKNWNDEKHFGLPPGLLKGITETLGFAEPSKI